MPQLLGDLARISRQNLQSSRKKLDACQNVSVATSYARFPRRASATIWSQARKALAWIVSAGFKPPEVTNTLASMIKRLGTSWARPHLSTTEDVGSLPMRQVPIWWLCSL